MTGRREWEPHDSDPRRDYQPDPRIEGAFERMRSGQMPQADSDREPNAPAPALVSAVITPDGQLGALPPPWYVPAEAPACSAVLDVAGEKTNDGVARRFACDRVAGHETAATALPGDPVPGLHRQVTDSDEGTAFTWPVDFEWPT